MPRNPTTGVFTRASNSFSNPLLGEIIDPVDAEAYFDDVDGGLNNVPAISVRDLPSITDPAFGAVGDWDGVTGTDNTAAINAALAAGTAVDVPPGNYMTTGTINIGKIGNYLIGRGVGASIITNNTAATPVVTVAGSIRGWGLIGLSIEREPTATAGGDGISQPSLCSYGLIQNVEFRYQYKGASLGPTSFGNIINVKFDSNISDGLAFAGNSSMQWQIDTAHSENNGGWGYSVIGTGTGGCAMGWWRNVNTFFNGNGALLVQGSATCGIFTMRITDAFFGADNQTTGTAGVLFDSYSGASNEHALTNVKLESMPHKGILISANNGTVNLNGVKVSASGTNGIYSSAGLTKIANSQVVSSGQVTPADGIVIDGTGRLDISNMAIYNEPSITTQQYGITLISGTGPHNISSNNFTYGNGNALGAIQNLTASAVKILNNTGATNSVADQNLGMNNFAITGTSGVGFNGASGSIFVQAPSVAGTNTLTLPAATDTLVGKATSDALTNKTVNGLTVTTSTGTLTIPNGVTLTGPASSGTAMTLGNTETVTGVKTFGSAGAVGRLKIAGNTSGTIALDATATAGTNTITLPAATDTVAVLAASQALTNKTYNGLTVTSSTGTLTIPSGVTLTGPAASGTAMTLGNTETVTGVKTFSANGNQFTGGANTFKQSSDASVQDGTRFQRATNDSQMIVGYETGSAAFAFDSTYVSTGGFLPFVFRTNDTVRLKIDTTAGATGITTTLPVSSTGRLLAMSGTAIPAGGTAGAGLLVSSTANFGVFFGSGAPSLSAAKGSLYMRSDGSSTSTRMYVNTDGGTTWTNVTTAA